VERDVGISARLLQVARSALFALPEGVTTIPAIVTYLGLDTIKMLLLYVEIVHAFHPRRHLAGFSIQELESHAFTTGRVAHLILAADRRRDAAFLAGLLHRVGQLVLADRVPHRLAEALDRAAISGEPLADVERRLMGVTHSQVGAYLLGLWGLPETVVSAVHCQGDPAKDPNEATVGRVVRLASRLARDPEIRFEAADLAGFDDRAIDSWRDAARRHSQT
jgi:HD-like signal output (HDOD) protein